jgi:cell division septum initiation protein DivIVA
MDRITPMGGNLAAGGNTDAVNAKVEAAAQAAHHATDRIAERAIAQVDRLSGTAHHAVDHTADAAKSAARWAANVPEQARQVQTRLTESASASIRARPLTTVAGALVVGYLLGRLARL